MAEYIEREELLKKLQERDLCLCVSEADIEELPAADVAPVVHGRWKWNEFGQMYCSQCLDRPELAIEKPYCSNCGTKMDMEEADGLDTH